MNAWIFFIGILCVFYFLIPVFIKGIFYDRDLEKIEGMFLKMLERNSVQKIPVICPCGIAYKTSRRK